MFLFVAFKGYRNETLGLFGGHVVPRKSLKICLSLQYIKKTFSEPYQTSKIEHFAKIVNIEYRK